MDSKTLLYIIKRIILAVVTVWIVITITFFVIKATLGLRVTEEEEIVGLDSCEHGLDSAYAGFLTSGDIGTLASSLKDEEAKVSPDQAIPVQVLEGKSGSVASDVKLSKVSIVCKQAKFEELKAALNEIGVMGITVTQVLGCGVQKGNARYYRGAEIDMVLLPKIKVEVIVSKVPVAEVVKAAKERREPVLIPHFSHSGFLALQTYLPCRISQ